MMAGQKIDAAALAKQLGGIDASSLASEDARVELLRAVGDLYARIETPYETVVRWAWNEPQLFNSAKIAVDVGMFKALVGKDDGAPKTSDALAAQCGVPAELAQRVLRQLNACKVVRETGENTFAPNDLSRHLTRPDYEAGIIGIFHTFRGTLALPELLRNSTPPYKIPTDPANTAWALGNNHPGESLFDSLAKYPHLGKDFANLMNFFATNRPRSWEIYPVQERLLDGCKNDAALPFLVDLGGSTGHDLKGLQALFPAVRSAGKLIDEDRKDIIGHYATELEAAGIVGVAHDFFQPQPEVVHGARAYFLHSIIHDWTDELSHTILKHIRDAMEIGYSRLLIHDMVIPVVGADWVASSLDMIMMANVAAKERTEREFRTLVESVPGLRVDHIFRSHGSAEGIIEISRVE